MKFGVTIAALCVGFSGCEQMPKFRFHMGGFATPASGVVCGNIPPLPYLHVAQLAAEYRIAKNAWPKSQVHLVEFEGKTISKEQLVTLLGLFTSLEFLIDGEKLVVNYRYRDGAQFEGSFILSSTPTGIEILPPIPSKTPNKSPEPTP